MENRILVVLKIWKKDWKGIPKDMFQRPKIADQ